jgi:hypothetical protein
MGTPGRQHSAKEPAFRAGGAEPRMPTPGTKTKRHMFGVDDRVACSTCGQDTYLRRRSAHSTDGDAYELQTFACRACKALTIRTVDSEGRLFG